MYRVLTLEKYDDHRGYFYESYSRSLARELNQVFVRITCRFLVRGASGDFIISGMTPWES